MKTLLNCLFAMGEKAGSGHMLKEAEQTEPTLSGQEIDEMGGNCQNRDNKRTKYNLWVY